MRGHPVGTSWLHKTHLCSRSKEHCLVIQWKTIQKGTEGKYHLLLIFSFIFYSVKISPSHQGSQVFWKRKLPLLTRRHTHTHTHRHRHTHRHTHTETHTHTHKVGCSLVKWKGSKLSVMGLTTPFIYLFKFPGRKDQKSLSDSKWCAASRSPYTHNCNCLTSFPS